MIEKLKNRKIEKSKNAGFTLVELMVSLTIFSLVMVVLMGSILSVLDANRKSQAERAVMDNLNFSLEGMTRTIRFGDNYHCGASSPTTSHLDCGNGADNMTVRDSNLNQVTYKLVNDVNGSRIVKTSGGTDYNVTSKDVTIQALAFYVYGSNPYSVADLSQPRVVIMVKGYAGVKQTLQSTFILETTISQRKLDF